MLWQSEAGAGNPGFHIWLPPPPPVQEEGNPRPLSRESLVQSQDWGKGQTCPTPGSQAGGGGRPFQGLQEKKFNPKEVDGGARMKEGTDEIGNAEAVETVGDPKAGPWRRSVKLMNFELG